MTTKTYSGWLLLDSNGEEDDILYLTKKQGSHWHSDSPLADILQDDIAGKTVTVRYYTSDSEMTIEDATRSFVDSLFGVADAKYCVAYSEITGYLWTDEELTIGGHDLLQELKTHAGKYLNLVAVIHEQEVSP